MLWKVVKFNLPGNVLEMSLNFACNLVYKRCTGLFLCSPLDFSNNRIREQLFNLKQNIICKYN